MPILSQNNERLDLDPGLEYLESQRSWPNRQAFFVQQVRNYFARLARQGRTPERTKTYRLAERVSLSPNFALLNRPLAEVLARRYTRRIADAVPIGMEELSTLLIGSYGNQKSFSSEHKIDGYHRTTPSPGGLYPSEIYFLATNVDKLENGLYHFNPDLIALEKIPTRWDWPSLDQLVLDPEAALALRAGSGLLMVTSLFDRLRPKYGNRYLRFSLIEVGCICQNFDLIANSLGLGLWHLGAMDELESRKLLDIDGLSETLLYSAVLSGKLTNGL